MRFLKTKKKLHHVKSQLGMSFIEVIVVLFIIIVLFDISLIEVNALSIMRKQRYENIAYHVANKQMESLRATTFASLPSSGTISDPLLSQVPLGSGNFTVSDYSGYSGIKELIVTIMWNDGSASKSVVIKTLAGNGGINP